MRASLDTPATRIGYAPAFDGLRCIAIALVLLHHLQPLIGARLGPLQPLAAAGWIGVDVFFTLSGFLITNILLASRGEPGALRNFYLRRALRILPLYYGLLTLIFAARFFAAGDLTLSPLWFYGFLSNF